MNKNVVISGASSGIGFEVAKKFALSGHKVLAIARSEDKLEVLQATSKNITVYKRDLSTNNSDDQWFKEIIPFQNIDVLINNAGALINKSFIETTIDDFKNQLNSNFITNVYLTKLCLPFMSSNTHIVNISSMGGFLGSSKFPGLSAYSSAKAAVSILTECLAEELKTRNISVNALALGAVQTEMLETAFPEYKAPTSPGQMADYIIQFALTASTYYNGKVLPVALGNP